MEKKIEEWISVKDALPENIGCYLCYSVTIYLLDQRGLKKLRL